MTIEHNHDHVTIHKCLIQCLQDAELSHGFPQQGNYFHLFPHAFSPFLGVLNKVNPNVVSTYHQNLMIILLLTTTTNNLQHSKTMWLLIRF